LKGIKVKVMDSSVVSRLDSAHSLTPGVGGQAG